MNPALRTAEHAFRTVLREGRRPPALVDIISEYDISNDHLLYVARFEYLASDTSYQSVTWTLDRRHIEESRHRFNPRRYNMDCQSLWSRLYEDHLIRLELAPRRAVLDELIRLNANPEIIEDFTRQFQEFERHVRQHHSRDIVPGSVWNDPNPYRVAGATYPLPFCPPPDGIPYSPNPSAIDRMAQDLRRQRDAMAAAALSGGTVTSMAVQSEQSNQTLNAETIRAYAAQMAGQRVADVDGLMVSGYERYSFGYTDFRGIYEANSALFPADVGSDDANKKGLELLRSWLTPEQLKQYDQHRHFEVVGSDTGKRYRIQHGRQMNIEELDSNGSKVSVLCVLPEGSLCAPDIMLGQKIGLEKFEKELLKKANRRPAVPSGVHGGGTVRWSIANDPARW